jgi:N-acetylglucosamine-6-phosphate deacetylase
MKKSKVILIIFMALMTIPTIGQRIKISNARIITPYNIIDNGTILIENGKITAVSDKDLPFESAQVIDAGRRYASPGFIDIHTHGGGGYDFLDGSVEAVLGIAELNARHGTTLVYPSTASCSNEELFRFFDAYREADKINVKGAVLGGVNIEGGYLNMEMRGGQDPRYIKNPTRKDFMDILDKGGDIIKRWGFAPELPEASELIDELNARGIQMSIAHSAALYEEACDAFNSGMNSITHFYSLTSTVTRRNALRYAGVIEAGYLFDDIYVEAIADGVHLPEPLLRLIYKVKGPDRIVLVTDAMRGAGMPEGSEIILGSISDGVAVIIEDGVAKLADRSSFAGSIATADRLVRTYMQKAGVEMIKAVQMITLTPAQLMKIDNRKGSIAVGKDADIILFDNDINV